MWSVFFPTRLGALWLLLCSSVLAAGIEPFVIAPMIEGIGHCAAGGSASSIPAALLACAKDKNPSGSLVQAALDQLEPGGAAGSVQVGYTVGINLMGFAKTEDLVAHLQKIRELILTTHRPVVLYLMGNQFAAAPAGSTLPSSSYAAFADLTIPKEHYFVDSINAWTLETDQALEVNRVRFTGLQTVGHWYVALPEALKESIVGITLAGELHHFFPDFANGMGRYDDIKVTDYSPASVRSFQGWLSDRYVSLDRLNQKMGTTFASFEAIQPPARDIRRDHLDDISQHFDAYAHGMLPVEGWLAKLSPGQKIMVYLNGRAVGEAEYGLSRQDVYDAVPGIRNAGVGFRYWLNFAATPRGIHTVQVVLAGNGQRWQIARRKIVLMGTSQDTPQPIAGEVAIGKKRPQQRFWLDRPRNLQDYYFNPMAIAWSEFRGHQVSKAYRQWFDKAVASGLPANKLYSHQIATATVGAWNPLLTASDASLTGEQPYKKGINLYGAALNIDLLRRHYLKAGEPFAVPEFHTQDWKNPAAAEPVLTSFRAAGARFMSPYFISIVPASLRTKGNPHDKFLLAPDNAAYGSNHLYRAIERSARD